MVSTLVDASHRMAFPGHAWQILSCLLYFLGITVLSHCISRRVNNRDFSWQGIQGISVVQICTLLIFVDSWLFLFTSGILIFGVGLESDPTICAAGIYLCIVFYATSKIFVYTFLVEKVYIVWAPMSSRRLSSPVYVVSMVTLLAYLGIFVLLFVGRNHYISPDGTCVIGLKPFTSIPLLAYDLYINVFLNCLFLYPLFRHEMISTKAKRIAQRTLIASGAALTTSMVNILVLTLLHGHELGWVCLGSCGIDVVINALALFWVTSGVGNNGTRDVVVNDQGTSGRRLSMTPPNKAFGMPSPPVEQERTTQKPSIFRIFRKSDSKKESIGPLQITITTEFDVETRTIGRSSFSENNGIEMAKRPNIE